MRATRKRRCEVKSVREKKKGEKRERAVFSAKMELQEYITGQVTDSSCSGMKKYLSKSFHKILQKTRLKKLENTGIHHWTGNRQ